MERNQFVNLSTYPIIDNTLRFGELSSVDRIPQRFSITLKPTPIRYCKSLSTNGVCSVLVKCDDDNSFYLSGNKLRMLEYSMFEIEAFRKVKGKKGVHVITCGWTGSNHCRIASMICRRLGYTPHIFLACANPKDQDKKVKEFEGNDFLDVLLGVDIKWISYEDYKVRQRLMEEFKETLEKEFEDDLVEILEEGGSNIRASWGYIECVKEIQEQCEKNNCVFPTDVFLPLGSGGTVTGFMIGLELFGLWNTKVWGICTSDDKKYFRNNVMGKIKRFLRVHYQSLNSERKEEEINSLVERMVVSSRFEVLDDSIGEDYGIPYIEEVKALRKMAENEGIVFDPVYGGKALVSALRFTKKLCEEKEKVGKVVMVLNSGGGTELISPYQVKKIVEIMENEEY